MAKQNPKLKIYTTLGCKVIETIESYRVYGKDSVPKKNCLTILFYHHHYLEIFRLIFVDLHKLEKTWLVRTFFCVHP